MNLSKSKYIECITCKKKLWLDKYKSNVKENIDNIAVFENGNIVHEIAKYLFGEHVNIEFNEKLDEMIVNTNLTIESYKNVVITEASFNYDDNFCSVDILRKQNNKYEIYEVKGSTDIKDIYIKDVSYQYYILTSLGLNVEKCYVVYLNNEYVRNGNLDLNKLFIKEDVTSEIKSLQTEVKQNICDMREYIKNEEEKNEDIDVKCFKPYKCAFYNYCSRNLPKNNIFDIANMRLTKKLEYYKKGIISFIDLESIELDRNTKLQIEYELNDQEDHIEKDNIRKFLDQLGNNIYFLDFETYQMPIPLYDGLKPYEQIPFQYSLHYIENGKLFHKEFLSESGLDPRRLLAERLIKDIPFDACILAYNMSFEKTVIRHLALMYTDLSDHLMNIYDNMKDLMIPFKNKWYYTKDMRGSYSIKYVLPALFPNDESLNYHNLNLIHNGSEAMNAFAKLDSMSIEEQENIRKNLLEYCKLDTYAMVKIYEKLNEVIK